MTVVLQGSRLCLRLGFQACALTCALGGRGRLTCSSSVALAGPGPRPSADDPRWRVWREVPHRYTTSYYRYINIVRLHFVGETIPPITRISYAPYLSYSPNTRAGAGPDPGAQPHKTNAWKTSDLGAGGERQGPRTKEANPTARVSDRRCPHRTFDLSCALCAHLTPDGSQTTSSQRPKFTPRFSCPLSVRASSSA